MERMFVYWGGGGKETRKGCMCIGMGGEDTTKGRMCIGVGGWEKETRK